MRTVRFRLRILLAGIAGGLAGTAAAALLIGLALQVHAGSAANTPATTSAAVAQPAAADGAPTSPIVSSPGASSGTPASPPGASAMAPTTGEAQSAGNLSSTGVQRGVTTGVVTSISTNTITVENGARQVFTFQVTSQTRYEKRFRNDPNQTYTLRDVKAGDYVEIVAVTNGETQLALQVRFQEPRRPGQLPPGAV
jgi:hypothetical protein